MADHSDDPLAVAFGQVEDPVLFHPLDELGILRSVRVDTAAIAVTVATPLEDYPAQHELTARLEQARPPGEDRPVALTLALLEEAERTALGVRLKGLGVTLAPAPAPGQTARENPFSIQGASTRVLLVASGKGGVGKSTVTVNLAVALARLGHRVGLLDADIYGFSAPRMLQVGYPPVIVGKTIVPPVAHGVRCISMGFFVDEEKAVAWRGPMLHKALEQFLVDVHWGALDFLLVDMPPGTGDVALSVGQQLPRAELYVVTTPQMGSARVAIRAGALARQLRLPVRGVVENMSWFSAPDGTHYPLFGAGGGAHVAAALDAPLLAQVPLVPVAGDGESDGIPAVISDPDGETAATFMALAGQIVGAGPARVYRSELRIS